MAAGNWLTDAGIGDANITVARRTIQVALRQASLNNSVIAHPVFVDMLARDTSLGQLMGELGSGLSFAALGTGKLAATAEGTEATATNFSTTNVAITPARKAFARKQGDWAVSLQAGLLRGEIAGDQYAFAMIVWEAFHLWVNQIVDMVVAHATSASNAIGTTATALTWGELTDGIIDHKWRGNQGGPVLGLLTEKGAKDLSADGLSLGGAVAFDPQMQQLQQDATTGSFLGRYKGVDFHLCPELDASGGDDYGVLLSPGAIGIKHQRVPLPPNADTVANLGFLTVEARRPGGGINTFETVSHNGSAILEQGRFAAIQYVS